MDFTQFLIIIFVVAELLTALFTNFSLNWDIAVKKGYETKTSIKLISLIPIYGNKYVKELENLKPQISPAEFEYIHSLEYIIKRAAVVNLLVLAGILIAIPVAILMYLGFVNNSTATIMWTFFVVILLLLHQGLVVEYAMKKGYEGMEPGLIGLIPVYGFIHFKNKPKRRNISPQALRSTFSVGSIVKKALVYGELSVLVVVVLIPILYIFGMAFSESMSTVPNEIWPSNPSWAGFEYLLFSDESKFAVWYGNTLMIAVINMLIGTVIITGAAYVFARFSFKGKKAGLLAILVLQAFPSFMGLIAMFVLFWKFNLLGQPIYLTILYIGGSIPGNLWLIKGFLSQIPKDLDESAMIDGASKFQIFRHIILPLAVPILTFVAVGMFMAPWMDYMLPGYLLNVPAPGQDLANIQNQWTLAVGIFSYINDINQANYPAFAAAALIVGLPIAVIYMVFQRYLIEGIMAGATKG
ncbi:sugar ABC transporter permease [Acholeplasma equirhinis]|uniref:sugar ABC transporter permease n=1 Tax=Acholeplasma equirhinis TaxID=555393 RepID=UPI00197AA8E5|nr:sugar ABC transporter permease [Acholeplasma equirhinis]MBN3490345.1 sugar ABC transporter permease [Acholeplasma equirhinis]